MRTEKITTLVRAGILSLAIVIVLGKIWIPDRSGSRTASSIEITEFEDTSSLVAYPLPAPTAEPQEEPPPIEAISKPLEVSEPVTAEVDADGKRILTDLAEPLPKLKMISEAPADPTLASPLPALIAGPVSGPVAGPVATKLAEATTEKPGAGLSETFINAVAAATTKDGAPAEAPADGAEPVSLIEATPDGFWLRQAKLNDVFQHLAQLGNYQYFHNTELEGPTFVVTGQLMNDDPIRQMEELSLMYGITIHQKGNTVYALTAPQLSQLPSEPFRYQLKYLRPSDMEQTKLILQPFLTPGTGIIEFESKTNTIIVMDNTRKLEAIEIFLEQIDQPKQQIAIETRILRITSNSRNRIGVDWSSVLGENGTTINAASSLNALFHLPDLDTAVSYITSLDQGNSFGKVEGAGKFRSAGSGNDEANLVFSPLQMTAVLRALNAGGLAQQESSPTLIAEDNEEGLISIVDRIPIITSTVSETTTGQNVTDIVRYKIDEADPVGTPADTREVGVSVAVTPTILPDGTIRMVLKPRSSQVVEYIESKGGNKYPRVNESSVTTTARVPNGHSLLIGGFYEEIQTDGTNKVPLLGDIPAVNLLFKSVDKLKTTTSLVFIVTPKLYRPEISLENDVTSHEIHDSHILPSNHDYPDPKHPGQTYRTDMRNTANNIFNRYKPDAPSNLLHPQHPYNSPQALPVNDNQSNYVPEPDFAESPTVKVRPASATKKNSGFLGRVFGGNKPNKDQ